MSCPARYFLASLFVAAGATPAQELPIDWDRLSADGVVVEIVETAQGHPAIRTYTTVRASREKIWHALVDYENFKDVFEGIRTEVLACDDDAATVEFWIDPPLFAEINFVLYRRYPEIGNRLTWTTADVKSGLVKDMQGSWRIFDAADDGTHLLVYDSYVDIGNRIVNWAARPFIARRAKHMTAKIATWIEQLPDEPGVSECPMPGTGDAP